MRLQLYPNFMDDLAKSVRDVPFWESYLHTMLEDGRTAFALHLGVFVEPYLQFILNGEKTIESRFSVHRTAPFRKVEKGDVLLLKRSGGPIVGLCQVTEAWFYHLDPDSWSEIKSHYAKAICAQTPDFWDQRAHASFATLMRIQHVLAIPPIVLQKRDRRGWLVLMSRDSDELVASGE